MTMTAQMPLIMDGIRPVDDVAEYQTYKHRKTGRMLRVKFSPCRKCGPACWHAVSDICECSCNGRNHGITGAR